MTRSIWQGPLALGLTLLLVAVPGWSANAPLGKVIPGAGTSALNGTPLKVESTLFSGDVVSTPANGGAVVLLREGDQVQVGPASAVTLTAAEEEVLVKLERGFAAARSGHGRQISMRALGLLIRPTEAATYQVTVEGNAVLVVSQQGSLLVQGSNRTAVVPSAKAMRFVLVANATPGRTGVGASSINEAAIAIILVAAGAITGAALAVKNHENAVSPSAP